MIHSIRIVFYQFVLVSNQNFSTIAVLMLAIMEASRVLHTSYLYFKMRHYKSVIHFLMDVTQSIFLFVFMLTALLLALKPDNEPVTRNQEMTSMWVIFMSCILEYAFMLIYIMKLIITETVFYFKTRPIKELVPKDESSIFDFVQYYYVDQQGAPVIKGMSCKPNIEMASTNTVKGIIPQQRLSGQRALHKVYGKDRSILRSRIFKRQPKVLGTENN